MFYQDRLGTNIGKVLKKRDRVSSDSDPSTPCHAGGGGAPAPPHPQGDSSLSIRSVSTGKANGFPFLRKKEAFLEFSLCLSRASLGKMIIFI